MQSQSSIPLVFGALVVAMGSLSTPCHGQDVAEARPPNVLLLIADDQGYGDFGAYGGAADASTPHLDRLAARGTRFTNAYVTAAICSPSRDGLLTGRYQQRWGSYGYGSAHLPADETTLAELLREQGYATAMIGKAHYGSVDGATGVDAPGFPLNHGFDTFFGRRGGTIDYVRHARGVADTYAPDIASQMGIGPFWEDTTRVDQYGYTTNLFTERALDFIGQPREQPFFLMLSYNAVHLFIHQFTDVQLARQGFEDVPELAPGTESWETYLRWYVRTVEPNTPQGRERYLTHLEKMDRSVGRVLGKLERTGQARRTLIVFLSDNGGSPFNYSKNAPLSGNKYTVAEGGIRVPFVVSWPARLPQGKVSDELVSALDVFPTVAAAAGATLPPDRPYDGTSLLPYLTGEQAGIDRNTLYWTGFQPLEAEPPDPPPGSPRAFMLSRQGDRHGWAVRHGDYKLRFLGESRTYRLYDVADDPGEHRDLSDRQPERVERLRRMWTTWHKKMQAAAQQEQK